MAVVKTRIKLIIEEIERNNYHLFLPIRIGTERCLMLVDTGASKTVFDSLRILRFVKQKNIKAMDIHSVGLGASEVKTQIVSIKGLRFGMMQVRRMEVAVLDLSHVNRSYQTLGLPQIDGVLGSDFFMKYKAVINFEKRRIVLKTEGKR